MAEKFLLKNIFDKKMLMYIAGNIHRVHPAFDCDLFVSKTLEDFDRLGLQERAQRISDMLFVFLPQGYLEAIDILEASLGPVIEEEELEGYSCFYVMPLGVYVSDYGLEYFDRSMLALKEMTKRFSSEWPIRSFIEHDEQRALAYLFSWTEDKNCHVRRLVSEGTRPRLPWGKRLKKYIADPMPVLNLLKKLKNEPTRLVQRSIANNLNDIAKDHPLAVVEFLQVWRRENVNDIGWIISHSCRSLIKAGDVNALALMGYKTDIQINNLSLELLHTEVTLGGNLEFSLSFDLKETNDLVIDYLLYFKKANGELKAKVFKLSNKAFDGQTKIAIVKKHPLKKITTRRYYEGVQALQLQINGKLYGEKKEFYLKV